MIVLLLSSTSMAAYAQQTGEGTAGYATSKSSVTGFVFDSEGEPLPGVTVKIPKKNVATVTDINGAFSIHGNTGDIISFSYIGKKPVDLKATVGSPMRVILDDDTETITEVVVTGIVNKDKNSFTGSASTFTAEELKMNIGCVFPRPEEISMEIKGRCLMTGLPRVFNVTSSEMIEAFEEPCSRILEAIHGVLERTPPELVADISTNGIVMTGGGSLLWGFDKLVQSHTGIETHVADDAISCVAYGTGKSLDGLDSMQDGTMNLSRRKQMNY